MRVSWITIKVQAVGHILDATVESIPVNGENVKVTQTFTYIGGVIQSSTSCELEVNRQLRQAWGAMISLDESVCRCQYLCERTEVRVFGSLVLACLAFSCGTLTITGELRRRLNSFGNMSLRRILGYRWHYYISNDLELREAGLSQVICIVRERNYASMGKWRDFPEDTAHLVVSCRAPRG